MKDIIGSSTTEITLAENQLWMTEEFPPKKQCSLKQELKSVWSLYTVVACQCGILYTVITCTCQKIINQKH